MPASKGKEIRSKGGRPKGSFRGRIKGTFAVKASPEYKLWMTQLAEHLGCEMSDLFREGMRLLAKARGFRQPPLK